ncbi:cyclin-dependent kinase inhibitor 1 [Esox lucius]|uniref:cyclin-dependent kinase inhibitor 1 n=1 Tax=Esox lucius TaxID=8010 RepID=UPI001476D651|nr:cyclin-dependent kinase inhibitor 1 [Esox lucius]
MCRTGTTMASRTSVLTYLGESSARRNLFGPVDHEQLQQEYQDALNRDLEAACYRWGFDFRSEKPLAQGHFQWDGVPEAGVPLLYRPADSAGLVWVGLSHCGRENISCTPVKYRGNCHNLEETPEKEENKNSNENGLKRKQTNLTDFYQSKKRVVGTPRKSGQ